MALWWDKDVHWLFVTPSLRGRVYISTLLNLGWASGYLINRTVEVTHCSGPSFSGDWQHPSPHSWNIHSCHILSQSTVAMIWEAQDTWRVYLGALWLKVSFSCQPCDVSGSAQLVCRWLHPQLMRRACPTWLAWPRVWEIIKLLSFI